MRPFYPYITSPIIDIHVPFSLLLLLKRHIHTHMYTNICTHMQVLESNRNQLEAKGVQLAANKQQLQTISLSLEDKDKVIADLKDQVKSLEKQLAGSLKKMLLQNEGILTENGETEVDNLSLSLSLFLSLSLPLSLTCTPSILTHTFIIY